MDSIACLYDWKVCKADIQSAFLQTGTAARVVYGRPPMESRYKRSHLWLLTVISYGPGKASAKWQEQSDN